MGKRRLIPLAMFVFLLVAALSSFAGPAEAQPTAAVCRHLCGVQARGHQGRGPSAR